MAQICVRAQEKLGSPFFFEILMSSSEEGANGHMLISSVHLFPWYTLKLITGECLTPCDCIFWLLLDLGIPRFDKVTEAMYHDSPAVRTPTSVK